MAPVELPDPSMHTTYIVDPRDVFTRYSAAFAATARMREGAQAGFLVLARLAYLAFGAVPGFFATRYLFALIAIVPAYVLVRRLYGIPAATAAVIVLLSCPVIITAWGTDYPDCAVVSYVAGAVACLAMPCRDRWRAGWLVAADVLLTLGIWSHGMGVVLAGTTIGVYIVVRLVRARRHLLGDCVVLLAVAVATTFLLMVTSASVLGQFDFIRPTLKAAAYLSQPGQISQWHSANWRWATYVAYLLVPPSVILAFGVTFARTLRAIGTPQLFVGLACLGQFAVFVYLQFFNHVQALEMHFFSSTIWGVVCLALAVLLAELARPLSARPLARWLPAVLVVAVPLAYEADPHVPAFGWLPIGAALAVVPVLLAGIAWLWNRGVGTHAAHRAGLVLALAATIAGMTGSLLVLTVAPRPPMPRIQGLATAKDPHSEYNEALGGNSANLIDWYQISADLPSFVGNATYKGEQLLMWFPWTQIDTLQEPVGIYHEGFDALWEGFPVLTPTDKGKLDHRRPAELLFLSTTGAHFGTALQALRSYRPVLVRTTVMHQGTAVLHAWLILLRAFARHTT
jgi:hypothetical protein